MATALKKTTNGDGLSAAVEAMAKNRSMYLDRIGQRNVARSALLKRQPSIEEQVKQSDAGVEALGASYHSPRGEILSPARADGALVDLTPVCAALAFFFPEVIKKKLADRIRAQATGTEIASAEKARLLAEMDAADLADWREFEDGVVAAERHGLRIARPGDMPLEIFLGELDSTGALSAAALEKVKSLERRRDARRGEQDEFHRERERLVKEMAGIEYHINELETLPRRPYGTTEVVDGQKKSLARLAKELADLNERNTQTQKEYAATDIKLLSRVQEFLRRRGIGVKPGTVELITAAR
jgi:hypothetical protein